MEGQYFTSSQALAERLRSNLIVCLILGILGLAMVDLLGSIPAWIWGNSIIKKATADGIPEDYVSNVKIGRTPGLVRAWIWVIVIVLSILFSIRVVIFGVTTSTSGYWSCTPHSTQNRTESSRLSSEAEGLSHESGAPELSCSEAPLR